MIQQILACVFLFWPLANQAVAQMVSTERVLKVGVPFSWPASVDPPPGAEPTRDQVMLLLKELYPDNEDDHLPVYDIEAFRFVPLAPGKIHLVVVADFTGRAFFNVVEVIHCEQQTCWTAGVSSDASNDLDKQLADVDGDGVREIITKELVEYGGAETKPIYTYSIYKLLGRKLVDVTSKHAEYFTKHVLPWIEETMREVEQWPDPKYRAEGRAAAQFAYDDYRRKVLGDKKAGFDHALAWLETENEKFLELAFKSLEAIDSPAAEAKLKELSQSPDKRIAEEAHGALVRRAGRRFPGEIK